MLHQYLQDIALTQDIDSLQSRLVATANHMGFGLMTAVLIRNHIASSDVAVRSVNNTPEAFLSVHTDLDEARSDPVMLRLMSTSIPFAYDQQTYVDSDLGHLWEVQAPFGFSTGIATALHLSKRSYFILGMDRHDRLPQSDGAMTRMFADLQLLAVHAHAAAHSLLGSLLDPHDGKPSLTGRELDCLRWALEGKTAWETGQILGISERTVNLHMSNAMKALKANTKIVAVVRAVQLGLL